VSLNAATIEILIAKGLSASDILDVARASEVKADRTNAERQARHRAKKSNAVTVTPVTETDPPNEYISNPPIKPCDPSGSQPPFAEIVVSKWNEGPAKRGARKAQRLDVSRKRFLTDRVKEFGQDGVLAAIRGIGLSDWHCGIGANGWKASLGWMLEKSKRTADAIERAEDAGDKADQSTTGQFDTPEARAAFLAKLEDKPWSQPPDKPPDRPAAYSASPPRTIGQITRHITQDQAA
jgi:hypothetical protein